MLGLVLLKVDEVDPANQTTRPLRSYPSGSRRVSSRIRQGGSPGTDQNQPASYLASLTCGSRIRAGQRAAAGKTTRAGPCGRRLLATAVAPDPRNHATLCSRRPANSALAPVTLH